MFQKIHGVLFIVKEIYTIPNSKGLVFSKLRRHEKRPKLILTKLQRLIIIVLWLIVKEVATNPKSCEKRRSFN